MDIEHHEQVVREKEEELAKALEEKDRVKDQLKLAESKLEDLKTKNNVSSSLTYTLYLDILCRGLYNGR